MKNVPRRSFLIMGFIGFGLLLTTGSAIARRRIRFRNGIRATGPKAYTTGVLSPSELEHCIINQQQIDQQASKLDILSANIQEEQQGLEELSQSLDRHQKILNRQSQADVNAYNRGVASYEKKRQTYNSAIEQYNNEVTKLNSAIDSFNLQCGQKTYYEDDMITARKKLGIADTE
jgi:hypothetical protein